MSGLVGNVVGFVKNNASSILTGGSVLGLVATSVLAVQATPKALDILADEGITTPVEAAKRTWKCYMPAIAIGGLTIASMVWSNHINITRTAALASVYSLSEAKLKGYQRKMLDRLGPKKARIVEDELSKEKMDANPLDKNLIESTGKGDTLCYDAMSGRYFRSDVGEIRRVAAKLSRDMLSESFVTLNELYSELGLKNTKMGEHIGWHIDDGYMEPYFSSHLNEQDIPCAVLDFEVEPRYFSC